MATREDWTSDPRGIRATEYYSAVKRNEEQTHTSTSQSATEPDTKGHTGCESVYIKNPKQANSDRQKAGQWWPMGKGE